MILTTSLAYGQIAHSSDYGYEYARSHSLYAPYTELELSSKYWDFGQDAVVFTQSGVRLTPDMQSRRGWLWSKEMISGSFEVDVEFKMHGENKGLAGDGMAFWMVEDKYENGEALGFKTAWNGIGVILDTYNNGKNNDIFRPHYVQAVYNDRSKYYNKNTDGVEMTIGGCSKPLRNMDKATRMRVTYIENQKIQLFMNKDAWADWELCFEKDLSTMKMPKELYFGFTAETGGLTDNHDIVAINTNKITAKSGADSYSGSSDNPTYSAQGESSILWTSLRLVLFVLLIFVVVIAYRSVSNSMSSSKRF